MFISHELNSKKKKRKFLKVSKIFFKDMKKNDSPHVAISSVNFICCNAILFEIASF